jgi:hypothetical protein
VICDAEYLSGLARPLLMISAANFNDSSCAISAHLCNQNGNGIESRWRIFPVSTPRCGGEETPRRFAATSALQMAGDTVSDLRRSRGISMLPTYMLERGR